MRKHSIKNTRVNGEVMKELSNIIRSEIKDPRIAPMTSVVNVEVAPDLKTCKAWISVLGSEEQVKDTLAGLKSAEGYIRRQLARTVNLRNTPEIEFRMDQSIEYGVSMSRKIDEVIAVDTAAAALRPPEDEETDTADANTTDTADAGDTTDTAEAPDTSDTEDAPNADTTDTNASDADMTDTADASNVDAPEEEL